MASDTEVLVVGGGVIGLAVAKSLCDAGREVILLEQHGRLGQEISSRNSEVIHAGIYYQPGSLRARLCVDGKKKLYAFAQQHGVSVLPCGKLLVATSEQDVGSLEALIAWARRNSVDDLVQLTAQQVSEKEPYVHCVAGCLSPSTGVIESPGLTSSLAIGDYVAQCVAMCASSK